MKVSTGKVRLYLIVIGVAGCLWLPEMGAARADNIYDSQVLARMEFSPSQRVMVEEVLEQSGRELAEIFAKYGIDPDAKPVFDKLKEARYELQAVEAREKRKMKRILSRDQFRFYLGLLEETAARVIKATRNKP